MVNETRKILVCNEVQAMFVIEGDELIRAAVLYADPASFADGCDALEIERQVGTPIRHVSAGDLFGEMGAQISEVLSLLRGKLSTWATETELLE